MNFNELQQQWNNEPTDKIRIPQNIDTLRQAQTPIDIVRKKMKNEFFIQIVALVFIAFTPAILHFTDKLTTLFIPFYIIMLGFTSYYYYKFYVFYKKSYDMTFDSRKNLLWFFYELKLSIELYKALTYIMFFLVLSFIVLTGSVTGTNHMLTNFLDESDSALVLAIAAVVGLILFCYAVAETTPKLLYGKHLNQVKAVLDQLDEE